MLDFPSSPTVGQSVTIGGVTWTWDGVKWTAGGTGTGIYLPLTGGTMTGDLILNRDPVVALGAATKQSVDARGAGDNRIINGDMRIDQRNNGASGTAIATYTVDRWYYQSVQAGKGTWGRATASNPTILGAGFPYNLSFVSSSAYASLTGDVFAFWQVIEADMISDFAWGTANAQPVTLSFWAQSSTGGTFSGSVKNAAATRSYPFSFTLAAGVWTKVVITIPGDTAGTWVMNGNVASLYLVFDLGTGSNTRGPANAWASTNYNGVTGAASVVGTNGAGFNLTGVKLEIGSVATPYPRQSLAKSLADCQRYWQTFNVIVSSYAGASGVMNAGYTYQPMRANPTSTLSGITYSNASALTKWAASNGWFFLNITITAAGAGYGYGTMVLDAEL